MLALMSNQDTPIRMGIVGCGVVATAYYLPYLLDESRAEITAVCDVAEKRVAQCQRLFGAKHGYYDYYDMLAQCDLDAVMILTGPGTHVPFTLAALEANLHVLQKPMALDLEGADAIRTAARASDRVVLIEPSDHSPLDPFYQHMRSVIKRGVLGDAYWFNYMGKGPDCDHPCLGGNPYGEGAFYTKDSGGILFDFPYGPNQIVSLLGSCRSVSAVSRISQPKRKIVAPEYYDQFLEKCTDPYNANYWTQVFDDPRETEIETFAPDNVLCTYEMANGFIGAFHTPRIFVPTTTGTEYGGLQIFGTEGNIVMEHKYRASITTTKTELLPEADESGWYNIPYLKSEPAPWPIPGKRGLELLPRIDASLVRLHH